jgi:glycosyltransferase involved in cell wall biosynthesis
MRIVIPAYRAASTLPRCLEAISRACAHRKEPVELVVVDDGDNGDIASIVAPFGARLVQLGPSGSAAVARNRGAMGAAPDDIVVFVDADVEVEPNAFDKLVRPIRRGSAVATIGNYSSNTRGLTFMQSYKQLYIWRVYSRRAGHVRNLFWSALCAIDAETFRDAGGFEPAFKGACDEDTDLGFRLTRAGKQVVAVPDAAGVNLKPYTLRTLVANDLHKGTSTIQVACRNRVSMSENRHASGADMLAVFLACATLALPLVLAALGRAPLTIAAAPLASTGVYASSRFDLLWAFSQQRGLSFALRAIPLMFVLDLVRGACVVLALATLSYGSVRAWATRNAVSAASRQKA